MSDYPFFIPEVVLCANSSLFWFKVANEHREFRNYLIVHHIITDNIWCMNLYTILRTFHQFSQLIPDYWFLGSCVNRI